MEDKKKILQELDELYGQLQKQAISLNRTLDPAQQWPKKLRGRGKSSAQAIPTRLSGEFTDLLIRYKQVQERFAQLR